MYSSLLHRHLLQQSTKKPKPCISFRGCIAYWGKCSVTKNVMTSSNGNIFRVTGPLCRSPVTGQFHSPVTRSFDVFFVLRLHKWLSKQSRPRWFETPLRSLWGHVTPLKWSLQILLKSNKHVHAQIVCIRVLIILISRWHSLQSVVHEWGSVEGM